MSALAAASEDLARTTWFAVWSSSREVMESYYKFNLFHSNLYNLVVADFHTYFVGHSKILSHDNTVRDATDAVVPGLVEE